MEKRKVLITDRDANGYLKGTRFVLVEWVCPVCGERMGEPRNAYYTEDDYRFKVHEWDNPCGHVAMYDELLIVEE